MALGIYAPCPPPWPLRPPGLGSEPASNSSVRNAQCPPRNEYQHQHCVLHSQGTAGHHNERLAPRPTEPLRPPLSIDPRHGPLAAVVIEYCFVVCRCRRSHFAALFPRHTAIVSSVQCAVERMHVPLYKPLEGPLFCRQMLMQPMSPSRPHEAVLIAPLRCRY
jgi:hypothetical protein